MTFDLPLTCSNFSENLEKTSASAGIKSAVARIDSYFEDWVGNFVHAIEHDLRRKYDLRHNIYLAYLATESMNWDILAFLLKTGCYSHVARELRSILESAFLFAGIEIKHPKLSLLEKVAVWKNLEKAGKTHGKVVFASSRIPNWDTFYILYRKLCGFTHPSVISRSAEIGLMAIKGQVLDYEFDETKFVQIYGLWMEVSDGIEEAAASMYSSMGEVPSSWGKGGFRRSGP